MALIFIQFLVLNSNLVKVVGTISTGTKWSNVNAFLYKRGDVAYIRFLGVTTEAINVGTTALTVNILPKTGVSNIPSVMASSGALTGTVVNMSTTGNCTFTATVPSATYVSFDFEYEV